LQETKKQLSPDSESLKLRLDSSVNYSNIDISSNMKAIEVNANRSCLSCIYLNARSIVNKVDELNLYITEEKPDIVGISETWLHPDIDDSEFQFDGYQVFRQDRKTGRGGGVALLVRNDLNAIHRTELSENFVECVWCEVKANGCKTLVGVCYRSPSSEVSNDEKLYALLDIVCKEEIVIMGDFNFAGEIEKWYI